VLSLCIVLSNCVLLLKRHVRGQALSPRSLLLILSSVSSNGVELGKLMSLACFCEDVAECVLMSALYVSLAVFALFVGFKKLIVNANAMNFVFLRDKLNRRCRFEVKRIKLTSYGTFRGELMKPGDLDFNLRSRSPDLVS